MAGRLHKYRQNLVIIAIVTVFKIVETIHSLNTAGSFDIVTLFNAFAQTLYWVTLSLAYIIRYKLHKEAGLTDRDH